MKRKRVVETEYLPGNAKTKKTKSQVKINENADSTGSGDSSHTRKKGGKKATTSNIQCNEISSPEPSTSTGHVTRQRKTRGFINYMGGGNQNYGLRARATYDFSSDDSDQDSEEEYTLPQSVKKKALTVKERQGVLKTANKKKLELESESAPIEPDTTIKKTKKKVRIDETESLKVKKEIAEPHFSSKDLPAKIIKSKLNKNLTEEVKVSPLTIQDSKNEKQVKVEPPDSSEDGTMFSSMDKVDSMEVKREGICSDEDDKGDLHSELLLKNEDISNGSESEDSELEDFYINKNEEKEAKQKSSHKRSASSSMPKEDQLILVQRMQEVIPDGDTMSYNYRLKNLEWQKVAFKDYSLEECQKVWGQLIKKVRHYRLLIEITHDVKRVIEEVDLAAKKPTKVQRKHPDMPKRPLTSYFLYYMKTRDEISKERPDLDTVGLNKFISEKYQNLPLEQKQDYEALATKNREEYKHKMEEFYAKHPEMRKVVIKRKQKPGIEKPPVRPENPYRLFMKAELDREVIAEEDKAEFKEVCREKWEQMPDSKKISWINLAEEHHTKYEKELKEYMTKHPEYTPKVQPQKPFLSQKELKLKEKLSGKPKKPPGSAYGLFISMTTQTSEIADIPPRERWYYTSARWKALSEEEKEQYKLLYAQVHEQYEKDFKVYLDSLPEEKRQEEMLKGIPKRRKSVSASANKPSTSGIKKKSPTTTRPLRNTTSTPKIENPTPPPRSTFKYFSKTFEGENPKKAWKNLSQKEKEKYEEELSTIKDQYIKDFEAFLKSLTKDELTAFCANKNAQDENTSSDDDSDSDSENGGEDSSNKSSDNADSDNNSDEN